MGSVPPLLSFLLMAVSGWVYRHRLIVIEFLQAENRLLKERLRGKRIRFTDAERALLSRKAKAVGRKALLELDTFVSPDTLMRWHQRLVAKKWDFSERRGPGRAAIMREISHYVLFVISLVDRIIHIAGITTRRDEAWMLQVGRNLIDEEGGALASKRDVIVDRDTKYAQQFRRLVEQSGTAVKGWVACSTSTTARRREAFGRVFGYYGIRKPCALIVMLSHLCPNTPGS
ncbi:MAG: hypothetical protein OER43_07265 [Gammaproteobacteria bacterium]|nr:hypothetical protein [Gammaproteobacteria bacterium]